MHHCCCNYPPLSPAETSSRRSQWNSARDSFRNDWSSHLGQWPTDSGGNNWPAHHVWDLGHGGHPTEGNNLLPVPQDIHEIITRSYGQCYAGNSPWNAIGSDYPYGE
jgi:hypothetical protein